MKVSFELAKALVKCWNTDNSLLIALLTAEGWKHGDPYIDGGLDALMAKHGIPTGTMLKQSVRPWIAKHFHRANDLLWIGKQVSAVRMMAGGADYERHRIHPKSEAIKTMKEEGKDRLVVLVRDRDKRTDWNTCK